MTTPYSFSGGEKQRPAQGTGKSSSGYFDVENGQNRMRILNGGESAPVHYHDGGYKTCVGGDECVPCKAANKASIKTYFWVQDQKDKQVKLYKMPWSVKKQLIALQEKPATAFSDLPMPYDITLAVSGAHTKEVNYVVMENTPSAVDPSAVKEAESKTPVDIIIEREKDKQRNGGNSQAKDIRNSAAYPDADLGAPVF